MTRDEIIKLVREACQVAPREDWNSTAWVLGDEGLIRFANLVAAAEREACAQVAENGLIGHTIAKAIRARGEK